MQARGSKTKLWRCVATALQYRGGDGGAPPADQLNRAACASRFTNTSHALLSM